MRNVDQVQDYTNYARGVFGYYYQCAGYSSTDPSKGQVLYAEHDLDENSERTTHNSQELRLSTPDDKRIRGVVGVYWEKYNIVDHDTLEVRDGSDLLADRAQQQLLLAHPTVAGLACVHTEPCYRLLRRRRTRLQAVGRVRVG